MGSPVLKLSLASPFHAYYIFVKGSFSPDKLVLLLKMFKCGIDRLGPFINYVTERGEAPGHLNVTVGKRVWA